jgi:hypothetical protein
VKGLSARVLLCQRKKEEADKGIHKKIRRSSDCIRLGSFNMSSKNNVSQTFPDRQWLCVQYLRELGGSEDAGLKPHLSSPKDTEE